MSKFDLRKYLAEGRLRLLKEEDNLNLVKKMQDLVDKNDFLKGKITVTQPDILEGGEFVLLFTDDSSKHIAERHLDGTKPGSLFNRGINLKDVARKIINTNPTESSGGRVKWLGVNGGDIIGEMGVAKASPEEVAKMQDYTMPDGAKEVVKIASGKREKTSAVSLITSELGALEDGSGRKALSLITMFPGGMTVGDTEIPMDRSKFASNGLYFVVDPSSPLLKKNISEIVYKKNKFNSKKLFEVLDDIKDAESASVWIKDQLDKYMKTPLAHYATTSSVGAKLESKLKELLKLVSKKFGIPVDSFEVEYKDERSSGLYSMGNDDKTFINGYIKLNGEYILSYSTDENGYGFKGMINENELLKAIKAGLEKNGIKKNNKTKTIVV